ncbi:ribonuclease R [Oceanobacillus picturae]|uniref:Ribonuclease R n=1 Tax=Oceanobacillus picturae TaxID=171693 RepID=A0A0U9H4S3_9BACI|nr:hypothetical protein [Oceanobacillus picturae]GAQ17618.1 ribonuclease R [Oceanobacillus picturae]
MRKRDCDLLVEECEELLLNISHQLKLHIRTKDKQIVIPKVKSFFEHCRSILEYCAQDAFETVVSDEMREKKLKSRNKNVYFPYGDKKEKFDSSINKNLPGLRSTHPSIYRLIEELQDYKRFNDKKFLNYMSQFHNCSF